MSRTRTVFETGLREYARTPVFLALLAVLPAYVIVFFARVMPERTVPLSVASETVRVSLSTATTVLMTPMVAALMGGIAGLFLMQSAREVDVRLRIVGARPRTLLAARFGVLAAAATVASLIAVGVMSVTHVPDRPGWFLAATVVVGLLYGGIGVLTGLVLNRLAGIYVTMFGPLLDLFLAQSPFAAETRAVAPYLPGHHPMQVAFDAAFTTGVDPSSVLWSLAYLVAVGAVTGVAFHRRLRLA